MRRVDSLVPASRRLWSLALAACLLALAVLMPQQMARAAAGDVMVAGGWLCASPDGESEHGHTTTGHCALCAHPCPVPAPAAASLAGVATDARPAPHLRPTPVAARPPGAPGPRAPPALRA